MVTGAQSNLSAAAGYTGGTIGIATGSTSETGSSGGGTSSGGITGTGIETSSSSGSGDTAGTGSGPSVGTGASHLCGRSWYSASPITQPRRFSSRQPH